MGTYEIEKNIYRNFRLGLKNWAKVFYPEELNRDKWFDYYTMKFDSVEINNTFYNLPEKETIEEWEENAPGNFKYAVKASRYITHMKKLKDPEKPFKNFISTVCQLDSKLGIILFQLPPHWKFNRERLNEFLNHLPDTYKYVFEFRERSWRNDETYELLNQHNVAFCIYHMSDDETPREITSDTIYIRLHGTKKKYSGSYSSQQLTGWKRWIENRLEKVKSVYVFFNNDDKGYAAKNAFKLKQIFS